MIEKQIRQTSIKVFIVALVISLIVSYIFKNYSYTTGIILGYLISLLVFKITVSMTDLLLTLHDHKYAVLVVYVMFIGKLVIYAAGLILAIKLTSYINYFAVFIGYFIVKITIYVNDAVERRKKNRAA